MANIDALRKAHGEARAEFEKACLSDYISVEDYEAIRTRYNETMRAYHAALGYGAPVGTSVEGQK